MNAKDPKRAKHLRPEELERLALPDDRKLPARSSAHAAECDRCQREVAELQSLHALLQALAPLQPVVGFSDRVMQRVRLPAPWRIRVLEAVRKHQVAAAAALAGAAATVGVGLTWIARYPELTPMTIAAFLAQRSTALLWGGVMEVGRFVYATGILQTAQGIAGQLTPLTAFVAVATVTVIGLASLRILLSLMDIDPALVSSQFRLNRRVRG
jgi:anti-sigma factor RsiW